MTRPTITPLENGPFRVEGLNALEGSDGPIDVQPTMALCRCGASSNKQFCDGSHSGRWTDDEDA